MKRAARMLALLLVVHAARLSAEEADGLDPSVRRYFYNKDTAVVARLDLAQIDAANIKRTVRGLFYDSSWPHIAKQMEGVDVQIAAGLKKIDSLKAAGFKKITAVVLGGSTPRLYFVEGISAEMAAQYATGDAPSPPDVDVELLGLNAVIHDKGVPLPTDADYDSDVEKACLLGLGQARGEPAVNLVAIPSDFTKAKLGGLQSAGQSGADMATALGSATYWGANVVLGDRPELNLFVRFSSEDRAADLAAQYKRGWDEAIALAVKSDADAETGIKMVSAITAAAMTRRIAVAMEGKAFGNTFQLALDTTDLRDVTGALIDRFYRKTE